MLKHVPNILTIIRFLLIVPILLFILFDNYILAIVILVISAITDILDGIIARKYNLISDFGKLMDPLADKVTQIATLIAIVYKGIIPLWILVVFLSKELILILGSIFLYRKKVVVFSKWYGKLATVVLYAAILLSMVVKQFSLTGIFITINNYLYYIAIAVTLYSLVAYCFRKDLPKANNS